MFSKLLNHRKYTRRNRRNEAQIQEGSRWRAHQLCLQIENTVLQSQAPGVSNNVDDQIIVSLTSFGQRLENVFYTIETILRQTLAPNRILLHLHESLCAEMARLPRTLLNQTSRGLEIVPVPEDLGPHTKYFYALKNHPNALLITVDDDVLYPIDMVEQLYKAYKKNPTYIHCHRAHRILTSDNGTPLGYRQWEFATKSSQPGLDIFPTGVGGVLYYPGCFDNNVLNKKDFMRLAPNADDVWLKAMSLKNNTPCARVEDTREYAFRFPTIPGSQEVSLKRRNKKQGLGNDAQIQSTFSEYQLSINTGCPTNLNPSLTPTS